MIAGHDIVEILINWFPMLLLIGVWLYFIGRMRKGPYGKFQAECIEVMRTQIEATRRQTESLERIATALERRT